MHIFFCEVSANGTYLKISYGGQNKKSGIRSEGVTLCPTLACAIYRIGAGGEVFCSMQFLASIDHGGCRRPTAAMRPYSQRGIIQ
jgi:hypothetical protein